MVFHVSARRRVSLVGGVVWSLWVIWSGAAAVAGEVEGEPAGDASFRNWSLEVCNCVEQKDYDKLRALLLNSHEQIAKYNTATAGKCFDLFLMAISASDIEALRLLLLAGVNPDVSYINLSPLQLSMSHRFVSDQAARLLLIAGADPNLTPKDSGSPPLFWTMPSRPNLVKDMLMAGADADRTDAAGGTVLHDAIVELQDDPRSLKAVVGWLLAWGAKTGIKDQEGKTPGDLAGEAGLAEIGKLIAQTEALRKLVENRDQGSRPSQVERKGYPEDVQEERF